VQLARDEEQKRVESGVVPGADPTATHGMRVAAALAAAESLAKTAVTLASQEQGQAAQEERKQTRALLEELVAAADGTRLQLDEHLADIGEQLGAVCDTTGGMQLQGSEGQDKAPSLMEGRRS
jgi:hypothetical protein